MGISKQYTIVISLSLMHFIVFASPTFSAEKIKHSEKIIADENKVEDDGIIDRTHKVLSESILLLTNRVDAFFGSTRADDESNGSTLKVSWEHAKTEHSEYDSRLNMRYNLKFPALQDKLKFRFTKKAKKEDEDKVISKESERGLPPSVKKLQQKEKRLRDYSEFWNVRLEGGVEARVPINPFINLRLWRPYSGTFWEFNPTHEFFMYWDQGFGTRHSFNVDFKINPKTILRIENSFLWTDETDEVSSTHGPSLFYTISSRRAISFNAKAYGVNRPTYFINNYALSASYRQLLYKNWFYYEVSPAIYFPSDRDFERIGSIFFKLEAIFGSI